MDAAKSPGMDYLYRKAESVRWHRQQSNQQILRSRLGFNEVASSRPKACQGCANYHGVAYGYDRTTRASLVCGFHPYGWLTDDSCPDWEKL
ncbi:hypothetical protein ACKFKF_02930 [Phormidesmis sp. 146-12]